MICPKCNAECIDGSTFCIKCGANLKELVQEHSSVVESTPVVEQTPVVEPTPAVAPAPAVTPVSNTQTQAASSVALNYFMFILAILLKPFKSYKEEESKLTDSKNSLILTLIVTGAATIINLIKTIYATVRVATYSWTDGYTYKWQWDNLKNIKWIEVIGKNFLIYACIIFAIAIVFYIGSLIVKKQFNFMKSLAISALSVIPMVIGYMVLSPLLGKIWSPLSIVFLVAGLVYSLVILSNLMNYELKLEGDVKIYFNLVCFGILAIAGYYLCVNLLVSSLTSSLSSSLSNIWG